MKIPAFAVATVATFIIIALLFCWAVYRGIRASRRIGPWRSVAGFLCLCPHLLFILSVLSSLACDNSHTQACYNVQFSSGVLIVFILPLPAIVGTILAIAIFKRR